MAEGVKLDLEKTYTAILIAARQRKFLAYGDLAASNGLPWQKVRRLIPQHLCQLVAIAHERGWPLVSSIVVTKENVANGELKDAAREGFIAAARDIGYEVGNPEEFVREQQRKVFAWAETAPENLGHESISTKKPTTAGPGFVSYFIPVINALRTLGGQGKPKDVFDWILKHVEVPEGEVDTVQKSGQTKFENRVAWARFYLAKAGLIDSTQHGIWALTPEGREIMLDEATSLSIFKDVQSRFRVKSEDDEAAPEAVNTTASLFNDPTTQFWFAGAVWDDGTEDQLPRFLTEGIWQNGYEDRFSDLVAKMRPGDKIAIKASFVKKYNLPFDIGGKHASCMRIKATGTITENLGDRLTVRVKWDPPTEPRDWYFYTYRTTLVEAAPDDDLARRLILFAFAGGEQDYSFWLKVPYFARKYALPAKQTTSTEKLLSDEEEVDISEIKTASYGIETIIEDGCFLSRTELEGALTRLKDKKNLILQGPPGTGKTWLAKRLGYALIGSKDYLTVRSRLRIVQFHPSLSYEGFVRGWRPQNGGGLALVDGVFMEAVQAALGEPDLPFVFIIEEINRGNPAQVFGEMLTLLENNKRRSEDALELAYRREEGDQRVHIPKNLYVIGTMNIADRSLALVDLALRRRFAFLTLEPQLGETWRQWCLKKAGFDEESVILIGERLASLNREIEKDRSLGPQFRIGHSFITPQETDIIANPRSWFRQVVETEIAPLLEEYWFDASQKAKDAKARLLLGLE